MTNEHETDEMTMMMIVRKMISLKKCSLIFTFFFSFSIFQNYVSALQNRVIQPGFAGGGNATPSEHSIKTNSNERGTLNSERTHFTNIPNDSDVDKMDIGRHERG